MSVGKVVLVTGCTDGGIGKPAVETSPLYAVSTEGRSTAGTFHPARHAPQSTLACGVWAAPRMGFDLQRAHLTCRCWTPANVVKVGQLTSVA